MRLIIGSSSSRSLTRPVQQWWWSWWSSYWLSDKVQLNSRSASIRNACWRV